MASNGSAFRRSLISLPRWLKRILLVVSDFCLLSFSLWAAFSLRLSTLYWPPDGAITYWLLLAPIIGIITFYARGLYRLVTRYIGQEAATRIYITITMAVLFWALALLMVGNTGVPRSVVIIYGLLAAGLIRLSRHFAGWVLKAAPYATPARLDPRQRVLIYGAGDAGLQLLGALNGNRDYVPVAFVDDDKSLWGQHIRRLKVYRPEKIERLIERKGVEEIFLAISSAPRHQRRAVIKSLERLPVVIKTLPGLEDIASGRVQISDLRPIDVEDLLGRDPVPPDENFLHRDILDKSVMITGAGGSIGSELTRQALQLGPRRLVLFELSEVALYDIESEARSLLASLHESGEGSPKATEIIPVLGSVLDQRLVDHTLTHHGVDTIYHAAALQACTHCRGQPGYGAAQQHLRDACPR